VNIKSMQYKRPWYLSCATIISLFAQPRISLSLGLSHMKFVSEERQLSSLPV
jgi:hypothetical protein